jgi:hypothetical protein
MKGGKKSHQHKHKRDWRTDDGNLNKCVNAFRIHVNRTYPAM